MVQLQLLQKALQNLEKERYELNKRRNSCSFSVQKRRMDDLDIMVDDTKDLMNLEATQWGKIVEKLNYSSIVECS